MTEISFLASGVPQPKGSTRSFVVRGRATTTADNPKTKGWQHTLALCARLASRQLRPPLLAPLAGPIALEVVFYLQRPTRLTRSAPARGRIVPHVSKPDLDKLLRACCDALTGVLWVDDAQIVSVLATKRYCIATEGAGAWVTVRGQESTDAP